MEDDEYNFKFNSLLFDYNYLINVFNLNIKIVVWLSILFEENLDPLIPVGPGAAAPPAPMVVTPLPILFTTKSEEQNRSVWNYNTNQKTRSEIWDLEHKYVD